MNNKIVLCIVAALVAVMIFGSCSSLRQGARDGVAEGISGLFNTRNSGSSTDYDNSYSDQSSDEPERNYSGSTQTVPWPTDTEWGRYGLAGLQQPPNTDVTGAMLYQGIYMVSLINAGQPAFDFLIAQLDKLEGAEIVTALNTSGGKMTGYKTSAGNVELVVDLENGDLVIRASR
jgi:hypothetical protein